MSMIRLKSPLMLGLMAASVSLGACQSDKAKRELAYVERPVEVLYNSAAKELDTLDYDNAIQLFNEVERQHPYSCLLYTSDAARRLRCRSRWSPYH